MSEPAATPEPRELEPHPDGLPPADDNDEADVVAELGEEYEPI